MTVIYCIDDGMAKYCFMVVDCEIDGCGALVLAGNAYRVVGA